MDGEPRQRGDQGLCGRAEQAFRTLHQLLWFVFTEIYLSQCDMLLLLDAREKIKDDLTGLWNYEKFGCPHREGNRYFFSKNSGLQNQRFAMILS